jgi:hypothetical protein
MDERSYNGGQSEASVLAEPALTDSEARLVLRRQFIGSVVAAMVVMALTGLTAMRSGTHADSTTSAPSRLSAVQQPTFVAPSERLVAVKQGAGRTVTQSALPAGM